MVLRHYGAPEFNPPDIYNPDELRGDHILKFVIDLPEVSADDEILN